MSIAERRNTLASSCASTRASTIRYLREREQVTAVYLERMASVVLETGERVRALTYVAHRFASAICGAVGTGSNSQAGAYRVGSVGEERGLRHPDPRSSRRDRSARSRTRMVKRETARHVAGAPRLRHNYATTATRRRVLHPFRRKTAQAGVCGIRGSRRSRKY